MTRSHWRIFCYLPGVKKSPCTCIQPYVYHGVRHVYAALFLECSPSVETLLSLESPVPMSPLPGNLQGSTEMKLLLTPLYCLSTFFYFFSFLDLAPNRPSLEFHPLSRLSCSNLLTLKQTGSLFCICIGLSMLVGKGEQYHFKT